jgi:hypothetical protein
MPLEQPEIFGTNADGSQSQNYCIYCYQNGEFNHKKITMQGMIDKCVDIINQQKVMPEQEARTFMSEAVPTLKRWRAEN